MQPGKASGSPGDSPTSWHSGKSLSQIDYGPGFTGGPGLSREGPPRRGWESWGPAHALRKSRGSWKCPGRPFLPLQDLQTLVKTGFSRGTFPVVQLVIPWGWGDPGTQLLLWNQPAPCSTGL